jgi:flavin-dependent dehydrogenase
MDYRLVSGSRVAVIGGGPAGTLFSLFLLDFASRANLSIGVDIYEPRRFSEFGPLGCNMCGGIISESLVQLLATEGIPLPDTVVQRGIDSYVLHTDLGRVMIEPPGQEKRIAAVHRGAGPRGTKEAKWGSFDGYLLELANRKGAVTRQARVEGIDWEDGKPLIRTKDAVSEPFDLVTVATGVNSPFLKSLAAPPVNFKPPIATKTFITDCFFGQESIDLYLGSSMHVFLLDIPRLEFAAIVPKGEFATICLLGEDIDKGLIEAFFDAPEVRECFPAGWRPLEDACRCFPGINITGAPVPFADRLVYIGDAGVNRLYKDGIGGSYRTAKAAARAAIFSGVSSGAFQKAYGPVCRALTLDNAIGRVVFTVTKVIQKVRIARRAVLGMTFNEQNNPTILPRMSSVLWDTFTGSAPYRDVFIRTLHPSFLVRLLYESLAGVIPQLKQEQFGNRRATMLKGELGKHYPAGDVIFRQGDEGDRMFVIQTGKVEVLRSSEEREVQLAVFGAGEIFGEMVMFGNNIRSATVRVLEDARILTIDRRIFMKKIHEDPSLAFRIMEKMSQRIRMLNDQLARTPIKECY